MPQNKKPNTARNEEQTQQGSTEEQERRSLPAP